MVQDKVINFSEMQRKRDTVQIAPVKEPVQQPQQEEIPIGQIDMGAIMQAMETGNFSDLEGMGISEEEAKEMAAQFDQYQKQQVEQQKYQLLGEIFQMMETQFGSNAFLDPNDPSKLYDELNEHILNTCYDYMVEKTQDELKAIEEANEAYAAKAQQVILDLAHKVKDIFDKEKKGEYLVKPEDRLETRLGQVDTHIYDIAIPGTKFRRINKELFQAIINRPIESNVVSYKILEFIINSVTKETIMLSDAKKKQLLDDLAKVPKFLDSIANKKIADYVIESVMETIKEEDKEFIEPILLHLFPLD